MTEKEKMIALYLTGGLNSREIGKELSVSPRTIEKRIEVLCDRFGARNRTHLVSILFRKFLIS